MPLLPPMTEEAKRFERFILLNLVLGWTILILTKLSGI